MKEDLTKEVDEVVYYITSFKEFGNENKVLEWKEKAKALKEKIEKGCVKWIDDFKNMSCVKNNLCPECQSNLNKLNEVLE